MEPPLNDLEFHLLRFDHNRKAAAFVAALSRFLNSPRGDEYMMQPNSAQVWSHSTTTSEPVEVYLSDGALQASKAAFAPPEVVDTRGGNELPDGCVFLIGGQQSPAWGLTEAKDHMSQSTFSQS